jgi:hypothetical protein
MDKMQESHQKTIRSYMEESKSAQEQLKTTVANFNLQVSHLDNFRIFRITP